MKPGRLLLHPLLWTAVLFVLLPYVAGANPFTGNWSGFVGIATTMVIFALFASGWNLLFGHVGELSFGHAMFFTLGAYTTALYSRGFDVYEFRDDKWVWGTIAFQTKEEALEAARARG